MPRSRAQLATDLRSAIGDIHQASPPRMPDSMATGIGKIAAVAVALERHNDAGAVEALRQIESFFYGGWPDDPKDQERILDIACEGLRSSGHTPRGQSA